MAEFYFGIDFGTTNSAVVAIREDLGSPTQFVPVRDGGMDPIPSIVSYDAEDRMRAGTPVREEAIALRQGGFHTVVESVKTVIEQNRLIDGKTPIQIASDLLAYLSNCAREDSVVLRPIDRAVFAIPVEWPAAKRKALREAAKRAGIDVAGFVSEPTAALLAMHDDFRRHEFIAVFDWGGGTLDVAILQRDRFGWREIAKRMLPRAGDAIDESVARSLHSSIVSRAGRDVAFEDLAPRTLQILRNRAEELKRRMQRSGAQDERVQLLHFEIAGGEPILKPSAELSKTQFFGVVQPIVNEAVACLEDVVRSSGVGRHQIGAVLAIGGSSQIVTLRQALEGGADPWPVQYGPVGSGSTDITSGSAWLVARGAALLARAGGRCARLADDIGLLVADSEQEFFSILSAGDSGLSLSVPREHTFGIVEDAPLATFIIAARPPQKRPSRIGEIGLPVQGFLSEHLRFSLRVDRDDVLRARAVSSNREKEPQEKAIENVRWSYDLESLKVGQSQ
ncbi:MAG: Hsp70 family protein [Acidobacteriota bacterium]|nr:Hsp70 family protein [Acidobacteriota bacterium]